MFAERGNAEDAGNAVMAGNRFMNLSIIIPVLNERRKIGSDIEAAAEFLHKN